MLTLKYTPTNNIVRYCSCIVSQFTSQLLTTQDNLNRQTSLGTPTHKSTIYDQSYSRTFCTNLIQPEETDGIIKKVMKKVGLGPTSKTRMRVISYLLYETVADKINYLEFFQLFKLPNTFNSWFIVTELHVWMLLLRAMAEGSDTGADGRLLRNSIVEAMWADVNTRAKKLGAHNPSGTRAQISELSEQFQASLISYDEGIMSDDKILAGALWRRFLDKNSEDYIIIEKLVLYVRTQVHMLDNLNRTDFLIKPAIQWIPLSKIKTF